MLKLQIWRNRQSYNFKADPGKPDGFDNNWKKNSLDLLVLLDGSAILFQCHAQTVANYCFGDMTPGDNLPHGDTVAAGEFTLKCFVEPRAFHGEIHAIIKTKRPSTETQCRPRRAASRTDGGSYTTATASNSAKTQTMPGQQDVSFCHQTTSLGSTQYSKMRALRLAMKSAAK